MLEVSQSNIYQTQQSNAHEAKKASINHENESIRQFELKMQLDKEKMKIHQKFEKELQIHKNQMQVEAE